MATMAFNKFFRQNVEEYTENYKYVNNLITNKIINTYWGAVRKGAMFDSRCFNVPKEEVTNFVYWRQLDAARNSIQMVGQANFPYKQLQGKSCNMIQDMLFTERGINWNDLPVVKKRGSACIKDAENHWFIDKNMPILKTTDKVDYRNYVDKLIDF